MSRRATRSTIALLLALALGGYLALYMPYVPVVHGSEPDEVERLVEWLDIEPGMAIADVGAGDGRFAFALAARVGPAGRIYATELSGSQLESMRRAVAEQGLENVTIIEAGETHTGLPDACCDAVFSRNVYHHLTAPEAINADTRRALRPGGRLLIIDFEPGGPLDAISRPETAERHGGHGVPKSTVLDEVTAAGFAPLRGPETWRGRLYGILFERPEA
jgi:ubiquinone/menaquinone biosynthesis C-methylase UbiE